VNYIVSDLGGFYAKSGTPEFELVTPSNFTQLVIMISANELSSRGAKDVLAVMAAEGGEPKAIAEKNGLLQVSDPEALRSEVKKIIEANPSVIEEYRAGKDSVLMFLVGQGMKAMKGAGNPEMIRTLLLEELS
jgi:aspartyl-tRNA(Asn)/glutamyl-tRNA(Gln) amidotransferase subunit B